MKAWHLAPILAGVIAGCDNVRSSPQIIEADGETYFACKGFVWTSNEGGLLGGTSLFKVSYTDAAGADHVVHGIRKLSISDLPSVVPAPMPYSLPDPKTDKDVNDSPYRERVQYTWADGTQARIIDGRWQAVMISNPACSLPK
jgi:hypothetical protein